MFIIFPTAEMDEDGRIRHGKLKGQSVTVPTWKFNSHDHKWEAIQEDQADLQDIKELKALTFNVWFGRTNRER